MSTHRIACTALDGRIKMGRPSKQGNYFVGEPKDVTSDVLRAIIDKAAHHGGEFEITGDGKKWIVTVKEESNEH